MRRLESYGLLESEWQELDGRRKRYYVTSQEGTNLLETLAREWRATNDSVRKLLEGKS